MEKKRIISKKKKILFYTILVCLPIAFFSVLYLGYTGYRSAALYKNIKAKRRGWRGNVHKADPQLGFSAIPNSHGAHILPIGPDIPMRFDKDGFRAPIKVEDFSKQPRPLIIALGCSFTYGDATYAKDTYPYLVGQSLKGTSKNAGVCSYGLSQMLLLAKKLIPIYKPDYLLVQYSTWLVDRAQNPFAPSYFGKLPAPFFYESDNHLALSPPVFLTKIMDLPIDRYRNTPTNLKDKFSFFWNIGLPLFFHDDFNMMKYSIGRLVGLVPKPAKAREKLIEYVYREIDKIAKKYRTKLVVVVLGRDAEPVKINRQLFPVDAILVNVQRVLLKHLSEINLKINKKNYLKEYAHWRGTPPRMVDHHPNETAHRIIADEIVSAIRQSGSQ